MPDNPNPQGKGQVAILNDWQSYRPVAPKPKSSAQSLADFFTSMLVLNAAFRFKPVVGQSYYLYWRNSSQHQPDWHLSLIEPGRWGNRDAGICLGCCELHSDMTWSIAPFEEALSNQALLDALRGFAKALDHHASAATTAEAMLPEFEENLPYYKRLAASGMAHSLKQSTPALRQLKPAEWFKAGAFTSALLTDNG